MKNKILLSFVLSSILCWTNLHAGFSIDVRQALQSAVDDAAGSLSQSIVDRDRTISVLPIAGDENRYIEGLLKNAVTRSGLTYVEGREDPIWEEVMAEVEWDERKEDMLDPSTLDKFGKLKSTQWLLYGTVREARDSGRMVYVELELHLSSIETKQHMWGDLVAYRFYRDEGVTGIINLDTELRNTLRNMLVEGVDSIKSNAKLAGVENVAIAPISGDIDGYVRSLSEDVLAQTNLMPVRLSAGTIGEARQSLRDNPNQADAILTGAVRDLSRTLDSTQLLKAVYEINAEVQLRIESVKDGSVLWSQTFAVTNTEVEEETEWDFIKRNKLNLALVGGAAVLFILFLFFLNATRRSR